MTQSPDEVPHSSPCFSEILYTFIMQSQNKFETKKVPSSKAENDQCLAKPGRIRGHCYFQMRQPRRYSGLSPPLLLLLFVPYTLFSQIKEKKKKGIQPLSVSRLFCLIGNSKILKALITDQFLRIFIITLQLSPRFCRKNRLWREEKRRERTKNNFTSSLFKLPGLQVFQPLCLSQ